MPTLAVRTDASTEIGSGHVMRCLTLTEELRARGWEVFFLCRELDGNLIAFLRERRGLEVLALPPATALTQATAADQASDAAAVASLLRQRGEAGRPDLLLVDGYAFDARWE